MSAPATGRPDLRSLTGVRTGKPTFYPQFRTAAQRLERVVHALDAISRALVRTVEGPETLVRAVVDAAAEHLSAEWVVFALADGALPDAQPRELVVGPAGAVGVPAGVARHLQATREGGLVPHEHAEHHVHVPVSLDGGTVGAFVAWTPPEREIDATDLSVLHILANQTAVALQNSALFARSRTLLASSETAYAQARTQAGELAARNAELEAAQRQLGVAQRRAVIDSERHRIARELHDSVTQCVLSAGMQIEVCRSAPPDLPERLDRAKDLTRRAVDQLRSAIYAMNTDDDGHATLPEMLEQLTGVHGPDELGVELRVRGRPYDLDPACEHALLRIAGEALFNAAVHAEGSKALVGLAFRPGEVVLSVDDDGTGDPAALRTMLRLATAGDVDGRHRGLANMRARAVELGGRLEIRRARLGGIRITARVPV